VPNIRTAKENDPDSDDKQPNFNNPIRRFCSLYSRATLLTPTGKRRRPVPVVPSDNESDDPLNPIHEEQQDSLREMILDFEATLTE
jgi:hypothetical protein